MSQADNSSAAEKMKGAGKKAGRLADEGPPGKAESAQETGGDLRGAAEDAGKKSRDKIVDVADDDEL